MPPEVGLWRVDGDLPIKVTPGGVPLESQLEVMIEADPTILGTSLLLIGRQVPTGYGKYIDLLAVDDEGALHILELKRDRIPREVVAQVLDYGSWVQTLTIDGPLFSGRRVSTPDSRVKSSRHRVGQAQDVPRERCY